MRAFSKLSILFSIRSIQSPNLSFTSILKNLLPLMYLPECLSRCSAFLKFSNQIYLIILFFKDLLLFDIFSHLYLITSNNLKKQKISSIWFLPALNRINKKWIQIFIALTNSSSDSTNPSNLYIYKSIYPTLPAILFLQTIFSVILLYTTR